MRFRPATTDTIPGSPVWLRPNPAPATITIAPPRIGAAQDLVPAVGLRGALSARHRADRGPAACDASSPILPQRPETPNLGNGGNSSNSPRSDQTSCTFWNTVGRIGGRIDRSWHQHRPRDRHIGNWATGVSLDEKRLVAERAARSWEIDRRCPGLGSARPGITECRAALRPGSRRSGYRHRRNRPGRGARWQGLRALAKSQRGPVRIDLLESAPL